MGATLTKKDGSVKKLSEGEHIKHSIKIRRFSAAFVKWARAGFPRRSKSQVKACLDICANCPHWKPAGNFFLGECGHQNCGCTKYKPQWATEVCPIGKWPIDV